MYNENQGYMIMLTLDRTVFL